MAYEFRTRTLRATPTQRQLADGLGLTYPPKISYGSLEELIRVAQSNAQPNAEQIDLAKYFSVEITDGMTSGELNRRLVPVVRNHANAAMRANPALRAGKIIRFEGRLYEITFIGGYKGRYVTDLRPLAMTGTQRVRQVLIKDVANAQAIAREVAMAMLQRRRRPALTH